MPTYAFRNIKTEEVFELFMGFDDRKPYLAANPDLVQTHIHAPACGNRFVAIDSLAKSTPSDYKGLLKRMKKNNPGSNINTLGA